MTQPRPAVPATARGISYVFEGVDQRPLPAQLDLPLLPVPFWHDPETAPARPGRRRAARQRVVV